MVLGLGVSHPLTELLLQKRFPSGNWPRRMLMFSCLKYMNSCSSGIYVFEPFLSNRNLASPEAKRRNREKLIGIEPTLLQPEPTVIVLLATVTEELERGTLPLGHHCKREARIVSSMYRNRTKVVFAIYDDTV